MATKNEIELVKICINNYIDLYEIQKSYGDVSDPTSLKESIGKTLDCLVTKQTND